MPDNASQNPSSHCSQVNLNAAQYFFVTGNIFNVKPWAAAYFSAEG